jgi:hypothetical protein
MAKGAYMITEIDIRDFDIEPVRELYKAKPRSYIQLPVGKQVLYYDHIDGSYSYCLDMFGEVVHLCAWASVHPLIKKDKDPAAESTTD